MQERRRQFIKKVFNVSLITLSVPELLAFKSLCKETVQLNNNQNYRVKNNEILRLPKNPQVGSQVYLHIDSESLTRPSEVVYNNTPILGEKSNLLLDSLANIRLKYVSSHQGWVLI